MQSMTLPVSRSLRSPQLAAIVVRSRAMACTAWAQAIRYVMDRGWGELAGPEVLAHGYGRHTVMYTEPARSGRDTKVGQMDDLTTDLGSLGSKTPR